MNVTIDFYSKPSSTSAYPIYKRKDNRNKQQGGFLFSNPNDYVKQDKVFRQAITKNASFLLPFITSVAKSYRSFSK